VGANNVFGRDVMEAAYCACLYAGISIDGSNPDIMPAQWSFKIGPCRGIDMGYELWMARFILTRVAEDFGVLVSFDPKPIPGRWNGSGAHCNFSTRKMRTTGGIKDIEDALDKLAPVHKLHLQHYDPKGGADITRRMEGADDDIIDDMAQFTAYKASRRGSVRIPQNVGSQGMGYLEDRRPASNCDPYSVTEILVRTTILAEYESHEEPIEEE
jgi:glutamine synthetase